MAKRSLKDKVVAVTGAGSGIGRALALGLAARGAKLALADRNAETLAETRALLGNTHALTLCFDVADQGALDRFAEAAKAGFGGVDGIINNAGLSVVAPFEETPEAEFNRVMAVNFFAVVAGTRAFLPLVKAQRGWVVNISSVFGLMPYPTQSAYCASKFAVRGFTETLRVEQALQGSGVCVLCVHPGGVRTNVARAATFIRGFGRETAESAAADFERRVPTTPEQAAETILRAMEREQVRVRIGPDARVIDWLMRLLPVRGYRLLMRLGGRD